MMNDYVYCVGDIIIILNVDDVVNTNRVFHVNTLQLWYKIREGWGWLDIRWNIHQVIKRCDYFKLLHVLSRIHNQLHTVYIESYAQQ